MIITFFVENIFLKNFKKVLLKKAFYTSITINIFANAI